MCKFKGSGKNKFLVNREHSVRYRIPDFDIVTALSSETKYNVTVHQLPDNDVLSIPINGAVEDDRPPIKDDYCSNPYPVVPNLVFGRLKSFDTIEVLWPTGCIASFWVYGSDVYINEYFPRPYFKNVLVTGK